MTAMKLMCIRRREAKACIDASLGVEGMFALAHSTLLCMRHGYVYTSKHVLRL